MVALAAVLASSCAKEYSASGIPPTPKDSFNLTLNFIPMADTVPVKRDSVYRNFWKESYSVSGFKFYISNIDLINTDSNRTYHVNAGKYYLVDAMDSVNRVVKLLAQPFLYNRISFLIGVDSAKTVTGPRTGSLDSLKGMFWNRTDGYVLAKLEGKSPVSPQGSFSYEVGGFTGTYNALRKPVLLFPFGKYLRIDSTGRKTSLDITADAGAWFYNPHQVKLQTAPVCSGPGSMAKDLSENYSTMFSVIRVNN